MKTSNKDLKDKILKMISAYKDGKNVMEFARDNFNSKGENSIFSILLSYDLQSGSYNRLVNNDQKKSNFYTKWGKQLAEILLKFSDTNSSFLEVGCGECTSMKSILSHFDKGKSQFYGFDLSWSRIYEGRDYLPNDSNVELFVADLFSIPFADNSIDIVYTSHSLEPNGGREKDAIEELLRVSKNKVILFEPIYELSSSEQKKRMEFHGYVKNLKSIAEKFETNILLYELLPIISNPMNASGVIVIEKKNNKEKEQKFEKNILWQCPITDSLLTKQENYFINNEVGLAYPILKEIPLLQKEHVIIASKLIHK